MISWNFDSGTHSMYECMREKAMPLIKDITYHSPLHFAILSSKMISEYWVREVGTDHQQLNNWESLFYSILIHEFVHLTTSQTSILTKVDTIIVCGYKHKYLIPVWDHDSLVKLHKVLHYDVPMTSTEVKVVDKVYNTRHRFFWNRLPIQSANHNLHAIIATLDICYLVGLYYMKMNAVTGKTVLFFTTQNHT